jgi:hypothetical protein
MPNIIANYVVFDCKNEQVCLNLIKAQKDFYIESRMPKWIPASMSMEYINKKQVVMIFTSGWDTPAVALAQLSRKYHARVQSFFIDVDQYPTEKGCILTIDSFGSLKRVYVDARELAQKYFPLFYEEQEQIAPLHSVYQEVKKRFELHLLAQQDDDSKDTDVFLTNMRTRRGVGAVVVAIDGDLQKPFQVTYEGKEISAPMGLFIDLTLMKNYPGDKERFVAVINPPAIIERHSEAWDSFLDTAFEATHLACEKYLLPHKYQLFLARDQIAIAWWPPTKLNPLEQFDLLVDNVWTNKITIENIDTGAACQMIRNYVEYTKFMKDTFLWNEIQQSGIIEFIITNQVLTKHLNNFILLLRHCMKTKYHVYQHEILSLYCENIGLIK